MPDDESDVKDAKKTQTQADANTIILGGLGIGAFGVISAAIGGAVCPVCVIAAPALLGIGAYKRWKGTKQAAERSRGSDDAQGAAAHRSKAG